MPYRLVDTTLRGRLSPLGLVVLCVGMSAIYLTTDWKTIEQLEPLSSNDPVVATATSDAVLQQQQQQHKERVNEIPCIRFAYIRRMLTVGLGNRLTEVAMGMKFAEETNSTYLFDTKIWSPVGHHGSYPWMSDFLPLHKTELTFDDLQSRYGILDLEDANANFTTRTGYWHQMVELSKSPPLCNVRFSILLDQCCAGETSGEKCWCTRDIHRTGVYEAVKGRLREAEANTESNYVPQEQLSDLMGGGDVANNSTHTRPLVSVAWHVRLGDITLNSRKDYFWAISTQLVAAFQASNTIPHVFFFGEGGESKISLKFPFLDNLCQILFPGRCSYPDTDPRDTFYHMIHCDVLVSSGSSFPIVAGVFRTRSRGMSLMAEPKEAPVSAGIYKISEQLDIDENGTIAEMGVLQEFLEERSVAHHQRLSPGVP